MSVVEAARKTSDEKLLMMAYSPDTNWDAIRYKFGEDEEAWGRFVSRVNMLVARHKRENESHQAYVEDEEEEEEETDYSDESERSASSSSSATGRSLESESESESDADVEEIPGIVVTHAPVGEQASSTQYQNSWSGKSGSQNMTPAPNPAPGQFTFQSVVAHNPFKGQAAPLNHFSNANPQAANSSLPKNTQPSTSFTTNRAGQDKPCPNSNAQRPHTLQTNTQPSKQQPAETLEASQLALSEFLNNPLNPKLIKSLHPKSLAHNPELKQWALLCEEVLMECSALYEAVDEPYWASLYRVKTEEFVRCRANGPLGSKFAFEQLVAQGKDAVAGRYRAWVEGKMRVLKAEILEHQRVKREVEARQKQQNEALQYQVNTTWSWGQPAAQPAIQPVVVNPPKLPTEMEGEYTGPALIYLPTEMDIDPPEPKLIHPLQTRISTGFGTRLQGFGGQPTEMQRPAPPHQPAKNSGFEPPTKALSPVTELDEPMSPPLHPQHAHQSPSNKADKVTAGFKDDRWRKQGDTQHQHQHQHQSKPVIPTGPRADRMGQSSHSYNKWSPNKKQGAHMTEEELAGKRRAAQYLDKLMNGKAGKDAGSDFSIKGAASAQSKGHHGKNQGHKGHHGRHGYHQQSGETSRNGGKGKFGRNNRE